ncbi:MAG TPA: cell division protein ZapA [Candidatus Margulisiibacteriota bacterium]|nr:cell division protein ZapA [Candidatus Margulisiibacteriota bacterium]
MDRPVEVEIMGYRLTVASEDSEEHIRAVAADVNRRMHELANGRAAMPSLNLALVTALNIASEWRKLQHQQQELCQTVNRTAQRVVSKLSALGPSVRKGESIARG